MDTFWDKVSVSGEEACWLWQGKMNTHGYGTHWYQGRRFSAHRYAYEATHGKIPDGLVVRHECDTRRCCNPAHLKTGTPADNSADRVSRGRTTSTLGWTFPKGSNAKKVACPAGHLYDEENTWHDPAGKRRCRECRRAKYRAARLWIKSETRVDS